MATTTLLVSKQMVSADALHAFVEVVEPGEAHNVNTAEPCYLLMARLANASAETVRSVASAA